MKLESKGGCTYYYYNTSSKEAFEYKGCTYYNYDNNNHPTADIGLNMDAARGKGKKHPATAEDSAGERYIYFYTRLSLLRCR